MNIQSPYAQMDAPALRQECTALLSMLEQQAARCARLTANDRALRTLLESLHSNAAMHLKLVHAQQEVIGTALGLVISGQFAEAADLLLASKANAITHTVIEHPLEGHTVPEAAPPAMAS